MGRLAAIVLCGMVATAGCGGNGAPEKGTDEIGLLEALRRRVELIGAERLAEVIAGPPLAARERVPGPSYRIARLEPGAEVEVSRRPGGPTAFTLGGITEFGSTRHFWAAERRGDWLGVPVADLPNGELGWIENDPDAIQLLETPYAIWADISDERLQLRYGKRVLEDFGVGIGGPGSPTPPGAYAVTDGLAGRATRRYYGCCVLALTGHQSNLPPDWIGGDRIAIHGTPDGLGGGSSAGCLRAGDRQMVSLFARVPLGAPVFIVP